MKPEDLNAICKRVEEETRFPQEGYLTDRQKSQIQLDIRALLLDITYYLSNIHDKAMQQ